MVAFPGASPRGPGMARAVTHSKPGPSKGVLPAPLPAGQIPPEDSRLWMFIPKAIAAGERWIQDDTRDWFDDHGQKVQVAREYMTHPRWMVGAAAKTSRGSMLNGGIVSEVHLLVRITAGLPEVPAWVPARLSLKQSQADLAYRLTKTARGVFIEKGHQAIKDFAERSPGQFVKWIGSTFIAKQIEQNVTITPGGNLDPEVADQMLEALAAEMKRREQQALLLKLNPTDFEVGPVVDTLQAAADTLEAAAGISGARRLADLVDAKRLDPGATRRLSRVIDLEADVIEPTTGEIEWD